MDNNGERIELFLKKNLQLLKQISPPSGKLKFLKDVPVDREGAEEYLYYLLQIINKQKSYLLKWPLYNTKDSMQFRAGVMKFISECIKENPKECYPIISQTTLLKPQSIEFKACLLKLCHIAIKVKRNDLDKAKASLPSNPESITTSALIDKSKKCEKELKKRTLYERRLKEKISKLEEGSKERFKQLKQMDCFPDKFLQSLQNADDLVAPNLSCDFLHSTVETCGEKEFLEQNDLVSYVHVNILGEGKEEKIVLDANEMLKDVDLDALSSSAETSNIKLFNNDNKLRLEGLLAEGRKALESFTVRQLIDSEGVESCSDLLPRFIALSSEKLTKRQQSEQSFQDICDQACELQLSCRQKEAEYYADDEEEEIEEDVRVIIDSNPLLNATPVLEFGGLEEMEFADSPMEENLDEFIRRAERRRGGEMTPTGPPKPRSSEARASSSSTMSPLAKHLLTKATLLEQPPTSAQSKIVDSERTTPQKESSTTIDMFDWSLRSFRSSEVSPPACSSSKLEGESPLSAGTFSESSDEEIIDFPSFKDFVAGRGGGNTDSGGKKRKSLDDIISRYKNIKSKIHGTTADSPILD